MEIEEENSIKTRDFSGLSLLEIQAIFLEQAKQIEHLTQRLNWFEEQFKLLSHHKFAASSEKQTALQLCLFDEGNADDAHDDAELNSPETIDITYARGLPNRKTKHIDTS